MYVIDRVCDSFVFRFVRRMSSGYFAGYCDFRRCMARCAMANEIESRAFRDRKEAEQRIIRYFERSTKQGTFAFSVEMFGQKEDE